MKKIIFLLFLSMLNFTAFAEAIKFATDATYPPFVTLDVKGNVGGFETELIKSICAKAKLECEFYHRPFDGLFPSLESKKIDAVFGCIGITEARKAQVLFSDSLYSSPVGFIFVGNFAKINVIGIQKGTSGFEQFIKKHYPNLKLKTYSSIQDALLDLKNKRIEGVFGDVPVFKYWAHHSDAKDYQYQVVQKEQMYDYFHGNGIALRKENQAILEKINKAIAEIKQEGRLQDLQKEFLEQEQ